MKSNDFETSVLNQIQHLKLGLTRNTVKLYNQSNKQIQFKTPLITLPFGPTINKFKTFSSYHEYYMDCTVDDNFVKEFKAFEEKLFPLILDNLNWFKTTFDTPPTTIQNHFHSPIRTNDYGHLLKITLPRNNTGDFDFTIWDHNSKQLHIDDTNIHQLLPKQTKFNCIVRITKLWGFKEQYGMILHLEQLKLSPPEKNESQIQSKTKQSETPQDYLLLE